MASSPGGVQAALIPYPAAKAYLSRHPLVRPLSCSYLLSCYPVLVLLPYKLSDLN